MIPVMSSSTADNLGLARQREEGSRTVLQPHQSPEYKLVGVQRVSFVQVPWCQGRRSPRVLMRALSVRAHDRTRANTTMRTTIGS
jgi:hypothetical protein